MKRWKVHSQNNCIILLFFTWKHCQSYCKIKHNGITIEKPICKILLYYYRIFILLLMWQMPLFSCSFLLTLKYYHNYQHIIRIRNDLLLIFFHNSKVLYHFQFPFKVCEVLLQLVYFLDDCKFFFLYLKVATGILT